MFIVNFFVIEIIFFFVKFLSDNIFFFFKKKNLGGGGDSGRLVQKSVMKPYHQMWALSTDKNTIQGCFQSEISFKRRVIIGTPNYVLKFTPNFIWQYK